MKKIIGKLNKQRTLGAAAFLISLSYLLSRLLGLVRDRLLASNFGIGAQTDAYTTAFRIPDLLFTLLVSGAFAVAFIPVFVGYLEKDKEKEAWKVANILLNGIILVTTVLGILAFIFIDPLVKMIAPGFSAAQLELTANLTRIMLVTPLLFGLANIFGAIQQSFNRFLLFALASVFYNLGIIFGILFLSDFFTPSIYGVAWGVVLGTALQAITQFAGAVSLGFRYSFNVRFTHPSVRKIVGLMIPRSLDLGLDQIHVILVTAIGSNLATGSLTSYYYANNLRNVPMGLFGGAIATAAFPRLIRAAKSKDPSKLPSAIVRNVGLVVFLTVPAAIIAIILRGYIVRLLFGFGDQVTADALGWLAASIVAQSVFFLIARVFYALEDTKTPLFASLAAIGANIVLSIILGKLYGVSGLAMALSITTTIELIGLMLLLRRKIGPYGLNSIFKQGVKVTLASLVMGVAMYGLVSQVLPLLRGDIGFMVVGTKFAIISAGGLIVYLLVARLLKIGETDVAFRSFDKFKAKWPKLNG